MKSSAKLVDDIFELHAEVLEPEVKPEVGENAE